MVTRWIWYARSGRGDKNRGPVAFPVRFGNQHYLVLLLRHMTCFTKLTLTPNKYSNFMIQWSEIVFDHG